MRMKQSQRWNTIQICRRRSSNAEVGSEWSMIQRTTWVRPSRHPEIPFKLLLYSWLILIWYQWIYYCIPVILYCIWMGFFSCHHCFVSPWICNIFTRVNLFWISDEYDTIYQCVRYYAWCHHFSSTLTVFIYWKSLLLVLTCLFHIYL